MNKLVTTPKIMRAHRARGQWLNTMVICACFFATVMAGASTLLI